MRGSIIWYIRLTPLCVNFLTSGVVVLHGSIQKIRPMGSIIVTETIKEHINEIKFTT